MPAFDLVIRGGTVVDGTGSAPREADVGIIGNKIAAVGVVSGAGAEEIDAKGKLVTPGFVDIHTHYDAQAVWDSHMAPSSWHGVTTAVMGNCGVGFAPCKPADRERLIELMEGVEDIPGAVMHEGLKWEWESFGEYLDALDRRPRDIDVCALLPHAAVRVFVMGDRAINLENANQGDIAQMREIAREAMQAGAFGFSTSRSLSHKTLQGDPTPTLRAQEDELRGIALGMKDAGSGMLEMVSEWAPDHNAEFAMLRRVIEASGRPTVFTLTQRHSRPEVWRDLLQARRQGGARRAADPAGGRAARDRRVAGAVRQPEPVLRHAGLQGDRAPAGGGTRPPHARSGGAREDPERGSDGGQHLPAVPPHVVRFHVPLRQSAELPAEAGRQRGGDRRARGPLAAGCRLRHADGGRRHQLHLHAARQLRLWRPVDAARRCWTTATASWASATAARMSRSFSTPATRPGCCRTGAATRSAGTFRS